MSEARQPTRATLRRYGLTVEDWRAIMEAQGWACGVCKKVPPSGTLHIDHSHARGFKALPPEEKRHHVRGVVCFTDNSVFLRRGATPERLRAAADYLEAYERRKNG